MAKRIVTNKFGLQGIYDDETNSVTPLSGSQKVITNKNGLQGVYDSETKMVTPIDGEAPAPTPKPAPAPAPVEDPKKKGDTESAGAPASLAGNTKRFGDLNTATTDNGELNLQVGPLGRRGGNAFTFGSSASTHTAEAEVAKKVGNIASGIGNFAKAVWEHPKETIKNFAGGFYDLGVDALASLNKTAMVLGNTGDAYAIPGAPMMSPGVNKTAVAAIAKQPIARKTTANENLALAEQMQKASLDKIKFGAPEGKDARFLTYDKKEGKMGMQLPEAEAFGYEAGKGIAQLASMAFGGELGLGVSFFANVESNYNEARQQGIPRDRALGEGMVRAGMETASDKYLGVSRMIENALAKGVSKAAINQLLTGEITKEAFGKIVAGKAASMFTKEGAKNIGKGFAAEFLEEFSQEYMDEGVKHLFNYYQESKKNDDPHAKMELYDTKGMGSLEMLTGALNSGVYGGIIGSMGGVFLNSKDYHPTIYSTLQNAYDDSGTDGLLRAKANIIQGVDKAIGDNKFTADRRELVLANLDAMSKNISSFQQKSKVDELTRYQKFDLENYQIPNNTAKLATYVASTLNDNVIPNEGDVKKDIEDGAVTEIPFGNINNVPDIFKPYLEKAKVFQEEEDVSVVAKVPNSVKAAYDQNQQTKSEFGKAVNQALNTVLGGSTNASYESVLYAGRQLFQDKTKQDAFEMELAQHEPAIKKRIQWSNYLHGLQKSVEKTGQPFDINARNKALDNINNFSEGQRVLHNGVENTIQSLTPDGQMARMANYQGEVSLDELQAIEPPVTPMPEPSNTTEAGQQEQAVETPVTQAAPKKAATDVRMLPISKVANDGKAYIYQDQVGMLKQDKEGRVTFESPSKIYELGNINDIANKTLGSFNMDSRAESITVNEDGSIDIDGQKYTNPATNPVKAITYDSKGQAISIKLQNTKGQTRFIRGLNAQTIDYKYKLKDFGNTASDIDIQSAIDEATTAVEESTAAVEQEAAVGETQQPTGETAVAEENRPVEQIQPSEEPSTERVNDLVEKIKATTGKAITAIDAAINSAANSLRDAGISVQMFNTTAEFNEAVGVKGNKIPQGIFLSDTGKIFLNREAMQETWETTIVWHEATHPVINIIRNTDPRLYNSVVSGVLKLAETNPQFAAVSKYVNSEYTSEQNIPDEILVEAIARIVSGKIVFNTVPTSLKEKLIDLVNKMAKALGMKQNLVSVSNEKEFKDLANKVVNTLRAGESIANIVGQENVGKYQLDQPSGYVDENGNDITNRQMQYSLPNTFRDPASGVTFFYLKDSAEFEQLKKDGFITDDKVLSDFNGSHIFLHQPDAAFTGMIMKNGQLLVKGNGGIFYPINFHKEGYFWASTSSAATAMAAQLNENARLNGGRVLMALTSAPSDKLLSSTTASSAVLDLFVSKTFDDAFNLTPQQVGYAIHNALSQELEQKILVKDKDGNPVLKNGKNQYVTKRFFLNDNGVKLSNILSKDARLQDMVSTIKLALAPDKSSFKERKFFAEQLLSKIADMVKGTPSEQKLGEFFHLGIGNENFKGAQSKGYKISAANLKQAVSYMLSEPLLRQNVEKGQTEDKGGKVYAILEMEAKGSGDAVVAVESAHHESYPMTVAKANEASKIKLHILQDRQMWSDHFQDFETEKIVEEDRLKKVYPTSGVSVRSLKLDIQKDKQTEDNRDIKTPEVKQAEPKTGKAPSAQYSQGDRTAEAYEFAKNNKDEYTAEELMEAIQQGFGYSRTVANAIVTEALYNPSSPSLAMVPDSKTIDESAPMNQPLGLKNDIIQGSREAVDRHLQEQEKKDRVTLSGLMEALVDDKWDIRKAIEKYSGKKGYASALLRTLSGINAAIDQKLKKANDEIYNGLSDGVTKEGVQLQGVTNLDRLIFCYSVIQTYQLQNTKRNKYYGDNKRKAIDNFFKENKRLPTFEEEDAISQKISKEADNLYPTMAHGVTTWDGKPDTVVTVEMARETVEKMQNDEALNSVKVGGFEDLHRRAMAYKRFANESLRDAHRAGLISDQVYEDYKDNFYSYRVTVDRLFESMSGEDQQINRRTMEKAFGTLSKTGTENAIMTNSQIAMGLSYGMMQKAIKRNNLKRSIYEDTVMKGLGGDLFKPANFLISKKTGEVLTDEKGDQVGSADSGFTHIGIKINGRNTYYQMKTSLFNQMEGLNKTFENPSVSEKFLQGVGNASNRTLTAFATRYNPLFFDSNIPMDLGQQIIFTDIWDKGKTYTNLLTSSFRAMSRTAQFIDITGRKKEQIQAVLEDWIEYGGSQDLMSLSKETRNEFLSDGAVTTHGDVKKDGYWRKFKDGVSYFNAKTEVAMRLAAFNEVRTNLIEDYKKENNNATPGEDAMERINTIAAGQSRAYTDFAQKGTYLPKWNMPYLNSSVQAFAAGIEYTVNNTASLAFKFAQMGVGGFAYQLGIMSAMAMFGGGGMDDVSEYEKDRNILIPLFFTKGKDKFGNERNIWHFKKIRVNPLIVPFWIATRKCAELAFNALHGIEKKPMTAGEMVDGTVDALNEAIPIALPLPGISEDKFGQRVGQILSRKVLAGAAYKYITGYDPYRGRDLRSYDDINGMLSAEGLDNKNVPYIYKFLGKTIGVSPIRTQAAAESFITSPTTNIMTGVAYSVASDLANVISPAATKTERGEYSMAEPGKAWSALGKKSFTQSNPDLQYNNEMNEKYKKQALLLKEANTKDRLMKIDLNELKANSENMDDFFNRAMNEYVPTIDDKDLEKKMSAYRMIEQMMVKGVKKDIFSEKSYMDAIILKNSGDAIGRAKMMEYMYGDNLDTANEIIGYSISVGLPEEDAYFALEEYKKLIKKK